MKAWISTFWVRLSIAPPLYPTLSAMYHNLNSFAVICHVSDPYVPEIIFQLPHNSSALLKYRQHQNLNQKDAFMFCAFQNTAGVKMSLWLTAGSLKYYVIHVKENFMIIYIYIYLYYMK